MRYISSWVHQNPDGRVSYENLVSTKHPLLMIKDGEMGNGATLLWMDKYGSFSMSTYPNKEQGTELWAYMGEALDNEGELPT